MFLHSFRLVLLYLMLWYDDRMSIDVFQNVLITGGAGFIGSHLVDRIRAEKPDGQITIIDNYVTGSKENILQHLNDPAVTVIEHDLTDMSWLETFLSEQSAEDVAPFSLILHFASPASPPRYQDLPVMTYQVNSMVTHFLAQYAAQNGSRMLFASTSEVYGDSLEHPQTETYWGNVNPNGQRSCYDEAKRLGETISGVWHREYGADTRLIRIFNTYGPRMDLYDGRVIPDFSLRALKKEPLEIYGDGQQTRSFCYVDDLVEGIVRFVQKDGLDGETLNLGNPDEYTMLELADKIESTAGYTVERSFHPLPSDDPRRRQPNISKAKALLDWEPRVSLDAGLRTTLEYFTTIIRPS